MTRAKNSTSVNVRQRNHISRGERFLALLISSSAAYLFTFIHLHELCESIYRQYSKGLIKDHIDIILMVAVFGGILVSTVTFVLVDLALCRKYHSEYLETDDAQSNSRQRYPQDDVKTK